MSVDVDIEKLAIHVAKIAAETGAKAPPFAEKIDALKTLTSYYAILSKNRHKADDADDANFDQFTRQVQETRRQILHEE